MRTIDRAVEQHDIAESVRDAIAKVPPIGNITLDVLEQGIYPSTVADQTWWRVPVVASPAQERLFPLYELIAEIQEHLQEHNRNIVLFHEDAAETVAA